MKKKEAVEELKKISKGEGGSWLYGFILMASGIFIIVLGILELLNYSMVYDFVAFSFEETAAMIPIGGIMHFVVGMFAVVSGFGLMLDQEWAWGISMLILVYNVVLSIKNIFQMKLILETSPSNQYATPILAVSIALIIISIIGLVYLGLTKYKYA